MPTSATAPAPRRILALDALRGVAILMVLLYHGAETHHYSHISLTAWYGAGVLAPAMRLASRFGWAGVDLFFVLSGYLIGGLLFAELAATGRLRIGRFLARRERKILPPYFAYMALAWLLSRSGLLPPAIPPLAWADARTNLLFLGNYLGVPPLRGHLWSLAVEEHFYVSLPLALAALARSGRLRLVPSLMIAAVLASLVGRIAAVRAGADPWHVYVATHLRLDGLALGVLLAYLAAYRPAVLVRLSRRPGRLALVGLALMLPVMVADARSPLTQTIGYTLLDLGCGAVLLASLAVPVSAAVPAPIRALAALGTISYPVYLLHLDCGLYPALRLEPLLAALPRTLAWAIGTGAYLTLAVGAGAAMQWVAGRPGRRITGSCQTGAPSAPSAGCGD